MRQSVPFRSSLVRSLFRLAPSLLGAWLIVAGVAQAASPVLNLIVPRGGQRGTEVEVFFQGDRMGDAEEVVFHDAGLEAVAIDAANPKSVKVTLRIADDCRLGEHRVRLRTTTGLSAVRTFWVGPFPAVEEKEPNNDPTKAQLVPLNSTVNGVTGGDVDMYAVELKAGQRLSAEVESARLGNGAGSTAGFNDTVLIIQDPNGKQLLEVDDTGLTAQDPFASIVAAQDGTYYVQVYNSVYVGTSVSHYRLHLGTFVRPSAVYPAGGPPGEEVAVQLLGDPRGRSTQKVTLPQQGAETIDFYATDDAGSPPSPNRLRVTPGPNVLEQEPNDQSETATATDVSLPAALNGILEHHGDVDWFRVQVRKGDKYLIRVHARDLGSPMDGTLIVRQASGGDVTGEDYLGSPDPAVRFAARADGDCWVAVRDLLGKGGPDFVYRIEFETVPPSATVYQPFVVREQEQYQQRFGYIATPRGNRFATLIGVKRDGVDGDLALKAEDLPPGVTFQAPTILAGMDRVPVVFEATPDAPLAAALVGLSARPTAEGEPVASGFQQNLSLQWGNGNRSYVHTTVDRLATATVAEAPFSIRVIEPDAALVRNGSLDLKIVAERQPGFTGEIKLDLFWKPTGVSAAVLPVIPAGANETDYLVSAASTAAVGTWPLVITGIAETEDGPVETATQLASLTVADPFMAVVVDRTSVQQGKTAEIGCKLNHLRPLAGPAVIALRGLPPGVTADPAEFPITASDDKVVFKVQADPKALIGQYRTLFCEVATTSGETSLKQIAGRGVLRIDVPRVDLNSVRTDAAP